MGTKCAVCGLPAHRYSTADPHHKYDAVACVNGLLPALDDATRRANELEAQVARLVDTEDRLNGWIVHEYRPRIAELEAQVVALEAGATHLARAKPQIDDMTDNGLTYEWTDNDMLTIAARELRRHADQADIDGAGIVQMTSAIARSIADLLDRVADLPAANEYAGTIYEGTDGPPKDSTYIGTVYEPPDGEGE